MLNQEERYRVLRILGQCCKFGVLPAQVNLSSWELVPHRDCLKIWKSRVWFSLLVVHALYKLSSLAEACFLTHDTPLHELIIHAVLAIAGSVYLFWYYVLFVKHRDVFGAYFMMTLSGNIGDELLAMDNPKTSSWIRRMKRWTLQDFFAVALPYTAALGFAFVFVALIRDPSMKILLYAGIPSKYQSWIIFCVLFLEEIRFALGTMSVALHAWILQIISIDLVNNRLKLLMDSINADTIDQEQAYKSLRHIQLYMGIFNMINSLVIFSWKILCISASIGTGYAAIAHFSDHPVFGVLYYLIVLDCVFLYIASYGKAFKIPALFEEVTKTAVLRMYKPNSPESGIFKRQMRSVPPMGIKVGEFHTIERESTLIFVDFVLNNIVSMLVANSAG